LEMVVTGRRGLMARQSVAGNRRSVDAKNDPAGRARQAGT
jgi:hypothetical protein